MALPGLRGGRTAPRIHRCGGQRSMSRDFDAIIIGSGPAGATAAEGLTAAGPSPLILERGRNHLIDLDHPATLPQRFSNDELKYITRHFLGPDPWAEPRTFRTSITDGDH